MPKTFKKTAHFKASPERLLEVLIDPEWQIAREKDAKDAVDATFKEISRTDDRFVYEVHVTEYAKGVTGIDKSKTEKVIVTYDWNLKNKSCTFSENRVAYSDRVSVEGILRAEAHGDGSSLYDEFTIVVKVPLVGKKIESMVVNAVEKGWDKFLAILTKWVEG